MVLVLQVLPGHFQLAFMTQFGVLLIVVWAAIERWGGRVRSAPFGRRRSPFVSACAGRRGSCWRWRRFSLWRPFSSGRRRGWRSWLPAQRDFEYLSGFASTPFHLVNFVAPGFFHRSPFWRPVVWDPFHTSPEELLAYVGLVPLFLAGMALVREWRRDAAVRLLAILFIATLVLSLGPYVPGFRHLIKLPGFSFFRAPSRWMLGHVAGAGLAGGQGIRSAGRNGRGRAARWGGSVSRRCSGCVAMVGLIELALVEHVEPGLADSSREAFSALLTRCPGRAIPRSPR